VGHRKVLEFYKDDNNSIQNANRITAMTVVLSKEVITTSDNPLNYPDIIAASVVGFMPRKTNRKK